MVEQFYLTIDGTQVLSILLIWGWVDLREMAIKGYSTFP